MSIPDADTCYRAVTGRDPRFDGLFFTAVTSTGIYCRPSCPASTPHRDRVRFYPSAASAQRQGFRACKRCRPDASPGSPEWNIRADVAGRAVRLIADGVVDRDGVPGLSARLGYSERQLHRTLVAELGAGPLALARSHRAQTARTLLETTDLPITDVSFAAGFASVRQFNDTVREVFAASPTELRTRRGRGAGPAPSRIELRLPFRPPMDVDFTLRWLGWHAVPGLESFTEDPVAGPVFRRHVDLPHAPGEIALGRGGPNWVGARLLLGDLRDLPSAVARARRLLDLDADPVAVDAVLAADPRIAPLVQARPGIRSPGDVDGFETVIRTVIGQQISLAGARTVIGRVVAEFGRPVPPAPGRATGGSELGADGPHRLFPTADALAAADPAALPMPRSRGRALVAVAAAFSGGLRVDPGVDREQTRQELLTLPGIGPWTADYVAMRSLGDPDVLLVGDLAARRIATDLGLDLADRVPGVAPWRSYLTHHLWAVALTTRPTNRKDRS